MDEEQETEVFLCDEPLPHSEEPEPFEVLEETAEGDQSEQSDEEDSSDLLEGCTRIMTRREERCLLAQQKAWTKSQGSVTVAELFSPLISQLQWKTGGKRIGFRHQARLGSHQTQRAE